jgi:hypothetical protein
VQRICPYLSCRSEVGSYLTCKRFEMNHTILVPIVRVGTLSCRSTILTKSLTRPLQQNWKQLIFAFFCFLACFLTCYDSTLSVKASVYHSAYSPQKIWKFWHICQLHSESAKTNSTSILLTTALKITTRTGNNLRCILVTIWFYTLHFISW